MDLAKKMILNLKIEIERNKLHKLIESSHLSSEHVLIQSQKIDLLLIEQMKLNSNFKCIFNKNINMK